MQRKAMVAGSLLALFLGIGACKSVSTQDSEQDSTLALGNDRNKRHADEPWVNWQWNNGARDDRAEGLGPQIGSKVGREIGVGSALIDLDKTRLTLVTENLNDTNGAFGDKGRQPTEQERQALAIPAAEKPLIWDALQDGTGCGKPDFSNPKYRTRSLDGSCTDFYNPKMGAVGERFPRNVSFASANQAQQNFAKGGLSDPNPRQVAEVLLRRKDPFQYAPAPFFNLWAGAWIQFMTHDWFSHAENGQNHAEKTLRVDESFLPADRQVGKDGWWTVASSRDDDGQFRPKATGAKPSRTQRNLVSHWWDGSQIYGWDAASTARVRDPKDPAKLLISPEGLLPKIAYPGRAPQEAAAFFDNWWVGLSLLHTTWVKEHNLLVDRLRDPANAKIARPPSGAATWSDEEAFAVARLSITALIAKIHTVEWTTQLLFNHVGDKAMNSNWNGLLGESRNPADNAVDAVVKGAINFSKGELAKLFDVVSPEQRRVLLAIGAAGSGITSLKNPEYFGSPFGLSEEFTAVYRLHSLIPDYLEFYDANAAARGEFRALSESDLQARLPGFSLHHPESGRAGYWWRPDAADNANNMIAVGETQKERSYDVMKGLGPESVALTFGLTPVGQLTLGNFPQFLTQLQNPLAPGGKIDLAAMDILRDRERGVPRYNQFRRELKLKPIRDFNDFIDSELKHEIQRGLSRDYPERKLTAAEIEGKKAQLESQQDYVAKLRELYGDVEKIDLLVGMQAEFTRPHGFAISETQFQVFILNASRRLFSDRFFNEAYNPKFYTQLGFDYVNQTTMIEVIRRQFPAMTKALNGVANAFEVWNRKRDGYSLAGVKKEKFLQ